MIYTVKTFEVALRDAFEDQWEKEEYNRKMMESLISTPPHPIYNKVVKNYHNAEQTITGTFGWQISGYEK